MAKTVTATAVKRIITKGLTGWEAGKLVLQDLIDTFFGKDAVLSASDVAAIQQAPMEGADIRDYNLLMGLYRGFHRGYMLAEWACKDACLQIGFLDDALQDADKRGRSNCSSRSVPVWSQGSSTRGLQPPRGKRSWNSSTAWAT